MVFVFPDKGFVSLLMRSAQDSEAPFPFIEQKVDDRKISNKTGIPLMIAGMPVVLHFQDNSEPIKFLRAKVICG